MLEPWPTKAWLWHNQEYVSLGLQQHGYGTTRNMLASAYKSMVMAQPEISLGLQQHGYGTTWNMLDFAYNSMVMAQSGIH